jgi:hypothetical protein
MKTDGGSGGSGGGVVKYMLHGIPFMVIHIL